MTIIDTPEGIAFARLLSLRSALKFEVGRSDKVCPSEQEPRKPPPNNPPAGVCGRRTPGGEDRIQRLFGSR